MNGKTKSKSSDLGRKLKYWVINSLMFILGFVCIYKFWLKSLPNEWEFYYYIIPFNLKLTLIFLVNFGLGMIISFMVRIMVGYWEKKFHPVNFVMRNFFQSAIYSLLIWIGVIEYLFETLSLMDLLLALFFAKMFVFYMSEDLADKIAFGK